MHRYADSPLLALIGRCGRIVRSWQDIGLARAVVARAVKPINIFGIRFHRLADCLPILCHFTRFRRRKLRLPRIGNSLPAQCRIARLPFLPHAAFYPALLVYIEQHDQLGIRRAVPGRQYFQYGRPNTLAFPQLLRRIGRLHAVCREGG